MILIATEPSFADELICRMLIVAEHAGLPTVLVLNKVDLVDQRERALAMLAPFRGLGYPLVELAGRIDIEPLRAYLTGFRSLFTGQSGMGKSTLVKALVPDAEVRIREISAFLDAGKQSTTGSKLYTLAEGTEIIDSPGVAEFGLAGMDYLHIAAGFREFTPLRGACRFQNCRHLNEPGCALHAAAESGSVHPRRLALYQRIVLAEETAGRAPMTRDFASRIFASINLAEVHHAKNLLDSVGIRSFVKNEALASAVGQLPFTDCQPELWLADGADAERARRVLSEGVLAPAEKGNVWQCTCGEIQEAQFTQCWRCGEFRQH